MQGVSKVFGVYLAKHLHTPPATHRVCEVHVPGINITFKQVEVLSPSFLASILVMLFQPPTKGTFIAHPVPDLCISWTSWPFFSG